MIRTPTSTDSSSSIDVVSQIHDPTVADRIPQFVRSALTGTAATIPDEGSGNDAVGPDEGRLPGT